MSKPKRGKHARATADWRGTCPSCERTRVKLLWTKIADDKVQQKVCKRCGD